MNKFQRNFFARFMDEANDGTEGGAGGATNNEPANPAGTEGGDGSGTKPQISDADAKLLKENLKKKEQIQDLTTKLTQATENLKAFEGLDPVAIRALVAKQKQDEEEKLAAKGDFDALKARMAEEHVNVVTGLNAQIEALKADLAGHSTLVNELTVGSQFNNSTYIKDKLILTPNKAKALYASHFELVDGQVVGYDKPRGVANRTAYVDATGAALSFDGVIGKLIEADPEKDSLLRSTVKPGANSGNEATKFKTDDSLKGDKSSLDRISSGLKGLKSS